MIYIHIPFCRSFCTYCDFYSEIACRGKDEQQIQNFISGLLSEIDSRREEISKSLEVNTLYLGGGTPSVLPLWALEKIVSHLPYGHFDEFTIEVNPDDVLQNGLPYLSALRSLGVNRVSMGVQSFDNGILSWMNRRHNAEDALKAVSLLREAAFDNISLDIIFGLSQLSVELLDRTLDKLLELRPEHISAYQLSIEEGSELEKMIEKGQYTEASDEQCAEQYKLICSRLSDAGYGHYEISNWALDGFEARHNSAYWTRKAYVGLGPGAHSFDGVRRRSFNSSVLSGWRRNIEEEILSEGEILSETVMLGLRTANGLPESYFRPELIKPLIDKGILLRCSSPSICGQSPSRKKHLPGSEQIDSDLRDRIRISEENFFVSNDIISELI